MLRNLIRQFATNGTSARRGRRAPVGGMTFMHAGRGHRGRRGRASGGTGAAIGAAVERFVRSRRH